MNKYTRYLVSLLLLLLALQTWTCKSKKPQANPLPQTEVKELDLKTPLQTIAFGSCNRQDLPQKMWSTIVANQPDLWMWLGDNVYGDTEDMEKMKAIYDQQKQVKEYQQLLAQCPILGTWDDHDYGVNDGGREFAAKAASKTLMLDFLKVPKNAAVRKRPGAYQSYTIGKGKQKVKVLLLDVRYFRDPLVKNPNRKPRYFPNETGTLLGEAQWQWLEKELQNSDAQIHLIAGGIQFIPQEHYFEKWANFPKERQRLLELLKQTRPSRVVLLSGDRHLAEVSKMNDLGDFSIYEVTSSGLTHSYEAADEANAFRIGPLIGQKNFGLLHIDWSGDQPTVKVQLKGLDNHLFYETLLDFAQ